MWTAYMCSGKLCLPERFDSKNSGMIWMMCGTEVFIHNSFHNVPIMKSFLQEATNNLFLEFCKLHTKSRLY